MSSTVLVTGASDGIGKQTALELAQRGLRVIVHGRTPVKAEAARDAIARASGRSDVEAVAADFGSLAEVRRMADALAGETIDVLINNAGVYLTRAHKSSDGFELTLAVNHLAHFVLTHRLLPALARSAQGRIVHVSSGVHASGRIDGDDFDALAGLTGYEAYAASKLANVLFSCELARRLAETAITSNALHPGVIATKLLRAGFGGGGAGLPEGAATSVLVATDPSLARTSGRYFSNRREVAAARHSGDVALQRSFYDWSARVTDTVPFTP